MRAVVQRVTSATVTVGGHVVGAIDAGVLVYVGFTDDDGADDITYVAKKIAGLRLFDDAQGRLSRSVRDAGGEALLVSQFTLYGDCRRGRRPSFDKAAAPAAALALYESLAMAVRGLGVPVHLGEFQAHMVVASQNDGPVTLLIDSDKAF